MTLTRRRSWESMVSWRREAYRWQWRVIEQWLATVGQPTRSAAADGEPAPWPFADHADKFT